MNGEALSWPVAAGLIAVAYLLGSIPFALLLGFTRGVDIRKLGSGNIGATNLSRVLGRRWGLAGFALDYAKGLLPPLAVLIAPATTLGPGTIRVEHVQIGCALFAILGHVFPIYLRFRGGKGVATSFGAVTALAPFAALAAGAVWLILYLVKRTVSIASLGAAAAFPVATILLFLGAPAAVAVPMDALAVLVAVLIVVRHRSNIRRLLEGSEGRF